jgi:uncharacterized coiled-coil protein SlyX
LADKQQATLNKTVNQVLRSADYINSQSNKDFILSTLKEYLAQNPIGFKSQDDYIEKLGEQVLQLSTDLIRTRQILNVLSKAINALEEKNFLTQGALSKLYDEINSDRS